MKTHYDIIIIGSGVAGLSAADAARKQDGACSILLIGREIYLPYYRIRLSKYFNNALKPEELYIHPSSWYEERNIDILSGRAVVSLHLEGQAIKLDTGEELSYQKLILTLGSRNFIPPVSGIDREGVFAVRDIEDIYNIQDAVESGGSAVVAGGGLLGLEMAWALKDAGLEVSVVEYFPQLLPKQVGKDGSPTIERALMDKGIRLFLGQTVEQVEGDGKVESVRLKDGTLLPCSLLVFSTGIVPNIDLLRDTGLSVDRGVMVDDRMQTSREGVYAAGDIAEYNKRVWGLWTVAQEQGKIAGTNAAGGDATYRELPPAPVLRIGQLNVFSIGEIEDQHGVEVIRSQGEGYHYKKLNIRDGKIIGSVLIGNTAKGPKLKTAVQQGKDISELLKTHPSVDEILEKL